MSVVVAIKENGIVYMAADTQITIGDSKRHLKTDSLQKIWAIQDIPHSLMGGVGLARDLNLIRYCTSELIPEARVLDGNIDVGTIMLNTVPVVFESIRNYTKLVTGSENDIPIVSEFIIACGDKMFDISADGTVEEVLDYIAIGSGADVAMGSLKNSEGYSVYDRLIMALEAAADNNLYVSEPYVCIDTDKCELQDLYLDAGEEDDENDKDDKNNAAAEPVESAETNDKKGTKSNEQNNQSDRRDPSANPFDM